jgi:hypothetical protein
MPKVRRDSMILTATPTTTPSQGGKRGTPSIALMVVIALLAIVVVGTGVGYFETAGGVTNYACMSVTHQGSDISVTTTGMVHLLKGQYYVTCTEGSNLPSTTYKSSCLTITPKVVVAGIGVGASTNYYYLSAAGQAITLACAAPLTNGTEIITPAGISLSVSC